jgi:Holliday junction resolvasome RuvABC DNA-binding subunit
LPVFITPGQTPATFALAKRITELPRQAMIETKRRTQLERKHLWGFLFEEEREAFRRAVLGPDPETAKRR